MLANWINQNPEKFKKRFLYEKDLLNSMFPYFQFKQVEDEMYVEGPLISNSNNMYKIRIFIPNDYPYSPPVPVMLDWDVVELCLNGGVHDYHNYGPHEKGGLMLCVLKPDDMVGVGWQTSFSVVTIILHTILWLHAYEYKQKTGKWLLKEA